MFSPRWTGAHLALSFLFSPVLCQSSSHQCDARLGSGLYKHLCGDEHRRLCSPWTPRSKVNYLGTSPTSSGKHNRYRKKNMFHSFKNCVEWCLLFQELRCSVVWSNTLPLHMVSGSNGPVLQGGVVWSHTLPLHMVTLSSRPLLQGSVVCSNTSPLQAHGLHGVKCPRATNMAETESMAR